MAGQISPPLLSFDRGITWLNTKTPANYSLHRRDRQDAHVVAMNALSYSRRKSLKQAGSSQTEPQPYRETDYYESTARLAKRGAKRCVRCGCTTSLRQYPYGVWDYEPCPKCGVDVFARSGPRNPTDLPDQLPRGTSPDPFECTPVPLDSKKLAFIKHIRAVTAAINWSSEASTQNGRRNLVATYHAHIYDYFAHPAPMSAYLSWIFCAMSLSHAALKKDYHRQGLQYYARAIELLRDLVAVPDDSWSHLLTIFYTVHCLSIRDFYLSGFKATSVHRKALKDVVGLLGGLDKVHWIHKEVMINHIISTAAFVQKRNELDITTFDPGPLTKQGQHPGNMLAAHASLHDDIQSPNSIEHSQELLGIFGLFREVIPVEAMKRNKELSSPEYDQVQKLFRWSFLRGYALRASITDYWYDIAVAPGAIERIKEEENWFLQRKIYKVSMEICLCLAAHLFWYLVFQLELLRQGWRPGFQFVNTMLQRCVKLRLGLDKTDSDPSSMDSADLLWIFAVGAQAENVGPKASATPATRSIPVSRGTEPTKAGVTTRATNAESSTGHWFSPLLAPLAKKLGYNTPWEVAELFQARYVYDPSFQAEFLTHCFDVDNEVDWRPPATPESPRLNE